MYYLWLYFSIFSVLVSIEEIYQTLKKVFDYISKHCEARQDILPATRCLEMWSNTILLLYLLNQIKTKEKSEK